MTMKLWWAVNGSLRIYICLSESLTQSWWALQRQTSENTAKVQSEVQRTIRHIFKRKREDEMQKEII